MGGGYQLCVVVVGIVNAVVVEIVGYCCCCRFVFVVVVMCVCARVCVQWVGNREFVVQLISVCSWKVCVCLSVVVGNRTQSDAKPQKRVLHKMARNTALCC